MSRKAMIVIALIVLLAANAWPQQSLVAELTKEESAKAAELYRKLTAAQADWESFRDTIRDKYGPALNNLMPKSQSSGIQKPDGTLILMPFPWA